MPMGITAINNAVPMKLKISFLLLKNEKECIPSSKYDIASARTNEIIIITMGNIRQQYLLFITTLEFKIDI